MTIKNLLFIFSVLLFSNLTASDKDSKKDPETIKAEKQKIALYLPSNGIIKTLCYVPTIGAGYWFLRSPYKYKFPILGAVGLFAIKKYNDYAIYGPGSTFQGRSILFRSYKKWKKLN